MASLLQALERICQNLQRLDPARVTDLQIGLSHDELYSQAQDFPYALPPEVVTLYRWHNGSRSYTELFWNYGRFLPLDEALLQYAHGREYMTGWQADWFPVFFTTTTLSVVQCSAVSDPPAPLYDVDGNAGYACMAYDSLTSMMETAAACYESGAFRRAAHGLLMPDIPRMAAIRRTHNPQWIWWWLQQFPGARRVEDMVSFLQRHEAATRQPHQSLSHLAAVALRALLDPRTIFPLGQLLKQAEVQDRHTVLTILGAFGSDMEVVSVLREAQHDADQQIRERAAYLLEQNLETV